MDFKLCKKMLLIALVLPILLWIWMLLMPSLFFPDPREMELKRAIFYYLDLLLPLMPALVVLYLFSSSFERRGCAFLYTLPPNRFVLLLVRWLRIVLLWLAVYIPLLVWCHRQIVKVLSQDNFISLGEFLFQELPNPLFLCALALLATVLSKQLFYGMICVGGYFLVDAATQGDVFGTWTLCHHLLYSQGQSANFMTVNRTNLLVGTVGMLLLAYLIYCSPWYRRRL